MKNIIKEIISISEKKNKIKNFDNKKLNFFIENFYSENKNSDFENYSADELANNVISNFNFLTTRNFDQIKIRVYNPSLEIDGFENSYTLIDIINNDMPFLVDSIVSYLDKQGIKIKNIIHPIISVNRDKNGNLIDFSESKESYSESIIQLHIQKVTHQTEIKVIQESILKILNNLLLVILDWKPMIDLANKAMNQIDNAQSLVNNSDEIKELKNFISWIIDGNFIFLGAKEFDIEKIDQENYQLIDSNVEGYGIFKSKDKDFKPEVVNSSHQEVSESVKKPYVIEILKSRYRSRIHRITNAERIRVQKISPQGKVIGEFRFIGMFTSSIYFTSVFNIPLIRKKINNVITKSKYIKNSHNYKDLISALEEYPRDELFQIDEEDLLKNATGIVAIAGRSIIKFFARKDKFSRFVSCLIFIPRDHSNSEFREKIKAYLCEIYNGEIADSFILVNDSNLTRFHVIIRTENGIPKINEKKIEKDIFDMTKVWSDDLYESIRSKFDDEKRISLYSKYKNAFSVSYVDRFSAEVASEDIAIIEKCFEKKSILFNLHQTKENIKEDVASLKIYSPNQKITLSSIMPILESFGCNVIQEHTYNVNITEDAKNVSTKKVWIHYFYLNLSKNLSIAVNSKIKEYFEESISLNLNGTINTGFLNKLVIRAELDWKKIYMLCAYSKYLYQTGFKYNQLYIAEVLCKYIEITKNLVKLFEIKFDPKLDIAIKQRKEDVAKLSNKIKEDLNNIKDSTEDSVVRRMLSVIDATTRTNYYQLNKDNQFKEYLSFKFNSKEVLGLPLPVPYAEIFVYSPRVEAIHLRGGKVARGGLRWSDRQEDFRTEVLGLMKAQMTKNAVIVPVGSKGGFVLKNDLSKMNRDEIQKEGIECYKIFLRGLLDITDNVINNKIIHPTNVVIHDSVDPYLVVAADKGTATFSDIANSVSLDYNFWLGDAFASGGSVGYDHKKMGITAKGAWISVMRHFHEIGINIEKQDFTVAGIGDLSGDVFGNGMLLSKHIKLIAAFNHLHIFLDPNPNSQKSFEERQRIFNLPRSTWQDYDKSLISKGGGIFERSAKTINISPEVKESLKIEKDELTPNELINLILKAPVDLLWNGGIGTYVKSSEESHQDVGDKTNDFVRVNGSELKCKVVGEGGNLGFTQKGRIEYANSGGKINTDAMDNSAGVDCSDHEVNIKIALTSAMRSNKISLEKRNKILESMTQEVASLVLSDNRLQTQAISIANYQGHYLLGDQSSFLDRQESLGLLNRAIEFLPNRKEIEKKQSDKIGLTRCELCVMLAYSKMEIYNQILVSDLIKDKYFEKDLLAYFPKLMQQDFKDEILNHQLRNEIIATQITNFIVNRVGITFINQICQESGFSIVDVVKSFLITCEAFRVEEVWQEVEKLDGKIPYEIQMQMFLSANKLLERSILWLLRNQNKDNINDIVLKYRKIVDQLSSMLSEVMAKASKESFERKIDYYCINNVEKSLSKKIAAMDPIASAFDIAEISAVTNHDLKSIAKVYFAVGTRFSLKWLRSKISKINFDNYWQKLSAKTILEDLYLYQMRIAKNVVELSSNQKELCHEKSVEIWIKKSPFLIERFDNFIHELKDTSNPDLSMFIVSLNRLKPLIK